MDVKARLSKFIVHVTLVLHYGYGIYIYMYGLKPPREIRSSRQSFGGHLKFLTYINMLLQFGYFTIAVFNDLYGSDNTEFRRTKKLQRFRDYLFMTIIFSVATFVSLSFWMLYLIDRDLIFPKIFDTFFPTWLNHNIHTTPIIAVLLEMWISPHFSPSHKKAAAVIFSFMLIYGSWICFIAYTTGSWVYPILQVLPVIGKAAFMIGMAILLYLISIFGDWIRDQIWGIMQWAFLFAYVFLMEILNVGSMIASTRP